MQIPASHIDILDKKSFAHLCTLMPDGSPQASPVWVTREGNVVVVNSAVGRVKDRNVRRDGRVAVSVTDPENPYRGLMIRGRVIRIETEGADAVIDGLAKKYMDVEVYPFRQPSEVRVTYFIEPVRVSTMGQ